MKVVSVHLFDFDRGELYKCLRKYVYANKPQFDDEYYFDDEECGFDKKSYSFETLKLIRGLFGVDTA